MSDFTELVDFSSAVEQEVCRLIYSSTTPLGDGSVLCTLCGTSIKQRCNLKRHMRDKVSPDFKHAFHISVDRFRVSWLKIASRALQNMEGGTDQWNRYRIDFRYNFCWIWDSSAGWVIKDFFLIEILFPLSTCNFINVKVLNSQLSSMLNRVLC